MSGTRDQSSTVRMLMRLGCALFGCLLFVPFLSAQTVSEYDVEAAYLYNFGKFVRWPADAQNSPTFNICVLGRDPFDGTLDRIIANNRIGGRSIQKRTLRSPAQADGCAILYIADSEAKNLGGILDALGDSQCLLVSGMPHFAQSGGTIQFVVEGDRVRFMVNLDAASKRHLTLSSELLKVALSVNGNLRNEVTR